MAQFEFSTPKELVGGGRSNPLFHISMLPVPFPQGAFISLTKPPSGHLQQFALLFSFLLFLNSWM